MAVLIAYMNGERVGEFTKLSNGAHQFNTINHGLKAR